MIRAPRPVAREPQSRRDFLRFAIGGVAAAAAVRTFPFRVYSFPSEIREPSITEVLLTHQQRFEIAFEPWIDGPIYRFADLESKGLPLFTLPGDPPRVKNHEARG